jgi:DNA-binding transcriptional regulator YiaG
MIMDDRIKVTEENFGELLIQALEEAVAIEAGELQPAQARRRKVTVRQASVAPPPKYTAARIARVRNKLGASQPVFAGMLNVSASTVRAWERGAREPDGPTLRLLEVAEKHPEVLTERVRGAGARE